MDSPIIHELKTLAPYWDAIERGDKTFEVRRDDRGFQKGDTLHLAKFDGLHYVAPPGARFGKTILKRRISYILTGGQFGIAPGFVVLGLAHIDQMERDE